MKDEEKTREQLISELKNLRQRVAEIDKSKSEREQAEIALGESELRFHSLIDQAPFSIELYNIKGDWLHGNNAWETLWGLKPEEVYGIFNIFKDKQLNATGVVDLFTKATQGEIVRVPDLQFDAALAIGKGRTRWLSTTLYPLTDNKNEPQYIVIVHQDITDRKQAEERFRTLFDTMAQGVVYQDSAGNIMDVNPSAERILGLSLDQMQGRTSFDPRWKAIHEDGSDFPGETHPAMVALKTGEKVNNVIMGVFHPQDEKYHWIRINSVPQIKEGDRQPYQVYSTFEDITEPWQLEKQLRQAQKMEAIGALTGGIAHEFNNLLQPILGNTEMLIRDKSMDDSAMDSLNQIQISTNRAANLVRQMLAYGRQSLSKREAVKLDSIIEDTIQLIKNTIPPNISIKKEIEVDLPPVYGMVNEIQQVLLNLCINASHAMVEGGELTIYLKNAGVRTFINLEGQKREGKFICFSVRDTGCGMDQDTLDRIFDPFFTTKEVGQGSGLGLSMVQGIVEQHKGYIEVDSTVGGEGRPSGTIVHVYLPVSQDEIKPLVVEIESLSQGNESILLIDDEVMIVKVTKRMLEILGYKVTEFLNGVEALNRFTEHPQDFDLVMTDYGLPNMNGKQLAEQVKKIRPDIPVILITGYGNLVAEEDVSIWGIDDLVIKPFELKELSEVVKRILSKKSQ